MPAVQCQYRDPDRMMTSVYVTAHCHSFTGWLVVVTHFYHSHVFAVVIQDVTYSVGSALHRLQCVSTADEISSSSSIVCVHAML